MPSFKDAVGREWTIELDGPTIRAVRAATCDLAPEERCRHRKPSPCTGVDLADPDGAVYWQLLRDPVLAIDVLWVLVREQAEKHNVSDAQFAVLLKGDVLEAATAAMLEAIADFFPKRKKEAMLALRATDRELDELSTRGVLERISDPQTRERARMLIEQKLDKQVQELLTQLSSATGSPASSASPPRDAPSGS